MKTTADRTEAAIAQKNEELRQKNKELEQKLMKLQIEADDQLVKEAKAGSDIARAEAHDSIPQNTTKNTTV